mmetsp:Transcript_71674/g.184847  ORF Transcript_71674/g.184847 Transcript_71674/m.184847 type:complete len:324 (-) Transcript_71674:34-1005(-)
MAGVLRIEGDGGSVPPSLLSPLAGPGEVETEFEDEGEEEDHDQEQQHLEEVEEELDDADYGDEAAAGSGAPRSSAGGEYAVKESSREVWKNFGTDTEAGRALRKLYAGKGMGAAAAKVAYPRLKSPASSWEPKQAPRKPCPQRAAVRVPVMRPKPLDRDDPSNWRIPIPCRKPAAEIMAEMEAARPEVPNLVAGRNQDAEKQGLQDRFRFCGGRAMPKGAMGHVEDSADLPQADGPSMREIYDGRRRVDENGMTAEHREIFEELMLAVQRKQDRIKEIDATDAADPKPSKAKTQRNKEALELRNDINRCLKDIDRLMEITAPE